MDKEPEIRGEVLIKIVRDENGNVHLKNKTNVGNCNLDDLSWMISELSDTLRNVTTKYNFLKLKTSKVEKD